jgi:endothelin-converting enzyme
VKAFQEKAQCVARTYSKYSITGPDGKQVHINGNVSIGTMMSSGGELTNGSATYLVQQLTNGEDLGDSGITFAFSAWRDNFKSKDEDTYLPGLDFDECGLPCHGCSAKFRALIVPSIAQRTTLLHRLC